MSFVGDLIGDVFGGITGANQAAEGADKAANAQIQAAREANQLQKEMYDQNRADMAPWREAGMGTLSQLVAGLQPGGDFNRSFTMNDFQADPGYAFRQSEGQKTIDNSAAARGSSLSGATLKALNRFGQDTASNEYQNSYNRWNNDMANRFNRLSGVAGTGQTATQTIGNQGQQTAQTMGQNVTGAGNARASGYIAQGNTVGNTFGSLAGLAGGAGMLGWNPFK
ncbi:MULTISPECIES: hypothetical protein [Comamonas]|uniref:hypothetical protein n=1 Tax=Comamonas TaxID=283 RepID=UPI0001DA646A|nr:MULTISPECIES: hypothetical protein [Comamonas]EFI58752.1 hypothetical protein CTS44_25766 [Comamonas thiooxydans]TFF62574.1 DNA transfer protein p32 [Comamonas sp. A23]